MGKYRAYETYKDSGVEWLSNIPKHWNKLTLRWLIQTKSGDFISNLDTELEMTSKACIPVVGGNGIMSFTDKENTDANTIIIGRVGAHCGNVNLFQERIWVTDNALTIIIKSKALDSIFLSWLLKSLNLNNTANKNAQPLITGEMVKNRSIAIPPLDEQKAIAHFLDHKTKQIDDLIAKKEALIEKLDEKRTALISHAVTKGLDPNVPMKDSGIEWLGEIPKHWNLLPLRRLMDGTTQNGLYKSKEFFNESGTPFIQMGEAFAEPIISKTAKDRILINSAELEQWGLKKGDLIFARRSLVFEGSGKCSIVGNLAERHVYESSMIRVCLKTEILNPLFAFFYFSSSFSRGQILSTTKQVTISGIDSQQLKSLTFLLPPIEEQEKIIKFIQETDQNHQKSTDKIRQAIQLLKEYRTALITNAVTGKIDIRQVPIP